MTTAAADLLETGTLEHVATVAKRVTGQKPSAGTIWRWCRQGLRGGKVRLACVYHAGCWRTTEAAFQSFIDAQTQAALAPSSHPSVTVQARDAEDLE